MEDFEFHLTYFIYKGLNDTTATVKTNETACQIPITDLKAMIVQPDTFSHLSEAQAQISLNYDQNGGPLVAQVVKSLDFLFFIFY